MSDCSKVRSHQPQCFQPTGVRYQNTRLADLCKILVASSRLMLMPMVCRDCWISAASIWPVRSTIHTQWERDSFNILKYCIGYVYYHFKCGTLPTVLVLVQANEHNFKLFFIGAKIFRKFFKVQHSILVGVPGLHNLKNAYSNENQISGQLADIWSGVELVIHKIGCKHKYKKT